jgi:riboflavin synthase
VSLTVSDVTDSTFAVSLIPTTLELTTLGLRTVGERVNVEVDVIAKYVERLLAAGADAAGTAEPSDGAAAASTTKEIA